MSGWAKKRRVMRRYDLTAGIYDMRYSEEQKAKIEVTLKNMLLDNDSLLLDAGCGTGLMLDQQAANAVTVVGLDISKQSLLQAKHRIGNSQNAHLVLADADYLPFTKGVFTHVFAMTLLQNMPQPAVTLRELCWVADRCATIGITGLKKIFTRSNFGKLLREVGLTITKLEENDLHCFVAVCAKRTSKSRVSKLNYI